MSSSPKRIWLTFGGYQTKTLEALHGGHKVLVRDRDLITSFCLRIFWAWIQNRTNPCLQE